MNELFVMETQKFLNMLWPASLLRNESFELRAINRSKNVVRRKFVYSSEEFEEEAKKFPGYDIYFGVSTRINSGGRKSNCCRVQCVWLDLDTKLFPDFPFEPDIVVNSGKGCHIYWLFEHPIFVRDGKWLEIEAVNRSLAHRYGGDINAIDITRILRVPGFYNYKYTPPRKVDVIAI